MTLPTSPSECHAPFTCAAAKRLWPFTETINEIAFLFQDYAASEYIEKEGPTYAAAQEAEYTHLLLMAVGASMPLELIDHPLDELLARATAAGPYTAETLTQEQELCLSKARWFGECGSHPEDPRFDLSKELMAALLNAEYERGAAAERAKLQAEIERLRAKAKMALRVSPSINIFPTAE